MELDAILKIVAEHMGVSTKDILMGDRTRVFGNARKIVSHIFFKHNKHYKTLIYSSNKSAATWLKSRMAMQRHLDMGDELAQAYKEIEKKIKKTNRDKIIKKRTKRIKATPFRKYTILDEIKIERAIENSIAFMEKYGRAI